MPCPRPRALLRLLADLNRGPHDWESVVLTTEPQQLLWMMCAHHKRKVWSPLWPGSRARLKEHCTQKKIWIHLMQNIFRNQTVKNLTILDNPFKRYDFSKFFIKFCEILMSPSQVGNCTISWVHNSPLVLYTDYHKFSIFLDMSKAVDQTHSKKHTDSYLPQTSMINK